MVPAPGTMRSAPRMEKQLLVHTGWWMVWEVECGCQRRQGSALLLVLDRRKQDTSRARWS